MGRHTKSTDRGRTKRSVKRNQNTRRSKQLHGAEDSRLSNVKVYLHLPSRWGTQTPSPRILLSTERANTVLEAFCLSTGHLYHSRGEEHNGLDERSQKRSSSTRLPSSTAARERQNIRTPRDGEEEGPKPGAASVPRALAANSVVDEGQMGSKPSASPGPEHSRSSAPRSRVEGRLGTRAESQLACPYTKFDGATFSSCQWSSLRRIGDLRKHLRKVHLEQAHCPTCHLVFRNAGAELTAHIRAAVCKPRAMPPRTMTPELWGRIREHTHQQAHSDEQRWYIVWDTLFPSLPRPSSPYIEPEPKPTKSTHAIGYIMHSIYTGFEQSVSEPPSPPVDLPTSPVLESIQHEIFPSTQFSMANTQPHSIGMNCSTELEYGSVRHMCIEGHSQSHPNSISEPPLKQASLPLHSESLDSAAECNDSNFSEVSEVFSTPSLETDSASVSPQPLGSPITSESEPEEYTSEGSPDSDSSQETVDERVEDGRIVTSTHQHVVNLIIDRVMERFWTILDQQSEVEPEDGAGDPGQRSTPGGSTQHQQTGNSSTPLGIKRARDASDEFGEEDDNEREAPPPARANGPDSQHDKDFGCPFRKHSPLKYTLKSHRICALNSWPNIPRLKEHLYRNHIMPLHCQRCWMNFDTEAQLDAHKLLPRAEMCEVRPGQPLEGITPTQIKELKSRKKRSRSQTEASRWRDIYRLLFPGNEVPSPYFEELEELGFVRREMPRLVRESLQQLAEQQSGPLEQALLQALPRLVQECLEKLESSMQGFNSTQLSQANSLEQGVSGCSISCPNLEPDDPVKKSPSHSDPDSQLTTPLAQPEVQGIPDYYGPPYPAFFQQEANVGTLEIPTSFPDQFGEDDVINYDQTIPCVGGCTGGCICWY